MIKSIKSIKKLITNQNQDLDIKDIFISLIFYLTVLLTLILLGIKNSQICLRYNGPRQCGFNRLQSTQFFLHSLKLIVNLLLSIYFQSQIWYQIIAICLINLLLNFNFYRNIIYEHPTIEYLSFLTQIYSWLLLLIYAVSDQNNKIKFYLTSMTILGIYIYMGLNKTNTAILTFLEIKYLRIIQNYSIKKQQTQEPQSKDQILKIQIIISLALSIFVEDQTNHNKVKWNQQFKHQVINLANKIHSKNQTYQVLKQKLTQTKSNQYLKNNIKQSTKYYLDNQTQLLAQPSKKLYNSKPNVFNIQKTILTNCSQKSSLIFHDFENNFKIPEKQSSEIAMFLCNIIWSHILHNYKIENSQKQNDTRQLFIFLCYNFPDYSPLLTHRMFYYYYKDATLSKNKSLYKKIESQLCYYHLREKVICKKSSSQKYPTFALKCSQNISNSQYDNKNRFQTMNQNYYNQRYIYVIKQCNLSQSILAKLCDFHKNQVCYLQLFQNISANKQKLLTYYQKRNLHRKQIEYLIEQYRKLKASREVNLLFYLYIKEAYLNNNPLKAYQHFYQGLQSFFSNLIGTKSQQFYIKIVNINKNKPLKRYQSFNLKQSIYERPICIVSGIQYIGTIFQSCSQFNKLLQINAHPQKSGANHCFSYNIHDFILDQFKNSHQNLISSIDKIFQENINHQENLKYFIKSTTQKFLYEVKFKIYFYLRYEKDFLMVLDFEQCKRVAHLKIQNERDQIIYQYSFKNKITERKRRQSRDISHSLFKPVNLTVTDTYIKKSLTKKTQFYQTQLQKLKSLNVHNSKNLDSYKQNSIQSYEMMLSNLSDFSQKNVKKSLFSKNYFISSVNIDDKIQNQKTQDPHNLLNKMKPKLKQQILHKIILKSSRNSKIKFNILQDQQKQMYQFEEQSQLQKQLKFSHYKNNFRFLNNIGLLRIILTFIGILIFSLLLYLFLSNEEKKLQKVMRQIQNKNYVDQALLLSQQRLKNELKMIRILSMLIQKGVYTKQLQVLLDNVNQVIIEIQDNIQEDSKTLELLAGQDPIVNYLYNDKCSAFTQNCIQSDQISQLLKIRSNWFIFQESMKDPLNILENKKNQRRIKRLFEIPSDYEGLSGLYHQINMIQNTIIQQIASSRFEQFWLYFLIPLSLTVSLIFTIFHIKKSVIKCYSYAVNTSLSFRMNFLKQERVLKQMIRNLQLNLSQKIFNQIVSDVKQNKQMQNSIVFDNLSRSKLNQQCKTTYYNFKRQETQMKTLKYKPFINLTISEFFIQAFVYPIVRFLSFMAALLIIYYLNSIKMQTVKDYMKGTSEIQSISHNLIELSYLTLYSTEIKQSLTQQQYEDLYTARMSSIDKVSKIKAINQIFPQQNQIVQQILFGQKFCQDSSLQECNTKIKGYNYTAYLETVARLLITEKILSNHIQMLQSQSIVLTESQFDQIKSRFVENYYRYYGVLKTAQSISEYGIKNLRTYMATQYYTIIFSLACFVTSIMIFQFYMQWKHMNSTLIIFNEEFLKIAPLSQLKNQQGYTYFINLGSSLRKNIT